jgi:hypothetical protein
VLLSETKMSRWMGGIGGRERDKKKGNLSFICDVIIFIF